MAPFFETEAFELFQRFGRRFRLRPSLLGARGAVIPKLADTVYPVTDADEAMAQCSIEVASASVAGGSGSNQNAFTVPSGERWYVHGWWVARVSGDNEIFGVHVYDGEETFLGYDNESAGVSELRRWHAHPWCLEQGWRVQIDPAGVGASTTVFEVKLMVKKVALG